MLYLLPTCNIVLIRITEGSKPSCYSQLLLSEARHACSWDLFEFTIKGDSSASDTEQWGIQAQALSDEDFNWDAAAKDLKPTVKPARLKMEVWISV